MYFFFKDENNGDTTDGQMQSIYSDGGKEENNGCTTECEVDNEG